MKFIHVSDLHFGKNLFGYSMITEGDQIFWIEQFLKLVRSENPDAIAIAGDVYDRGIPPKEAVKLLDVFVSASDDWKRKASEISLQIAAERFDLEQVTRRLLTEML